MAFVFESNTTINPWGREDLNNLRAWASGHENEDEKEKISLSSSFFGTTTMQEKGGGDGGFQRAGADELWVQVAEEWATKVDDAAAWSDVVPTNGTEVTQYNNQPVGARGYITNNILIRSAMMREEEEEMSSFFSSSFDAVTVTTVTNAAPAKDGSEEEAVDKTAGGNGLFDERRTEEVV